MKRIIVPSIISLAAMVLLTGCIGLAFSFGGGKKDATNTSSTNSTTSSNDSSPASNNQRPTVVQQTATPTIGQQLIDVKKAKDAGAITDAEYETEKAKLLNQK